MNKLICGMILCVLMAGTGGGYVWSADTGKAKSVVQKPTKPDNPERELDAACSRKYVYKKVGDLKLNIWVFNPQNLSDKNLRPAIVFFFGGGWSSRNITQFMPHAKYFASRDMITFIADYRTRKVNGTSPVECVKDGKSAVRWIRANAKLLGVDPNRIVASGGSAGGHIAAATATLPGLEETGENLSVSSKPDALVLFNPVFDNGPNGYGYDRVGGAEGYRRMSPIDNIRPGAPPTIVFLGTSDKLIPIATAKRYKTLMEKAGSRCELKLYDGQGHGFFNASKNNGLYFLKTVRESDLFLKSLGYLKGAPTIDTFSIANY